MYREGEKKELYDSRINIPCKCLKVRENSFICEKKKNVFEAGAG
jgi:hypothetical protein